MNIETILLFLGLALMFAAYVWLQQRKISDGKALWWATVSEPLHYVSDDPDDDNVVLRAEGAREKLRAHGNKYLNPEADVWEFVYSAMPQTATRDFAAWQDYVQLEVVKRREAWRMQKAQWNEGAAKRQFAGQAQYTATASTDTKPVEQ